MRDEGIHEVPCLQSRLFPVGIFFNSFEKPCSAFPNHWHDHLEFLFVQSGEGVFECDFVPYQVKPGDLIVVNSGELHSGYTLSPSFSYYCIIVDPTLIQSSFTDLCDIKYISPITQNLIQFNNRISEDTVIIESINRIISEHEQQSIGYELSIKAEIYRALVLLIRKEARETLSSDAYKVRQNELLRLGPVLQYIEEHYSEKINGEQLANLISISYYHFCRLFKQATGKTVTEYINKVRIKNSIDMLNNTNLNITEISLATGFTDINYFIRLFKTHIGITPLVFRSQHK